MTIRMLLACGLVTGMIGGCASRMEAPPEAPLDTPVDYQLLAFEATQHVMLHIEPDGTMTRTRMQLPAETANLDPATLEDIARKIDDAEFPALAPTYGCGGCTDDAVYTVAVQVDGAPYTVRADSTSAIPDRLRPVIDTLRNISELPLDWR